MMLGFLMKKPIIAGLAGLAIITVLGLGYRHYTGLLRQVDELQAHSAVLGLGLETERATVLDLEDVIGQWKQSQAALVAHIKEMQENAHDARAENRRLRQLFAEMDFEDMAPAALDSFADSTTARMFRLLDAATDPSAYAGRRAAAGEDSLAGAGSDSIPGGGLDGDPD